MIQRTLRQSLQSAARQSPFLQPARSQRLPIPTTQLSASTASRTFSSSRWRQQESAAQAEETAKDQAAAQGQGDPAQPAEAAKADPAAKELETKKKEVIDLTDRLKRSVADYRNLQEQTKREIRASKDFAIQSFAKDLIESIDNLDRALTNTPAESLASAEVNPDLKALHGGLKMTETILMQTLKKHGLERMDPAENNDKFDPNRHEATFQAPQQGKEDGTVFYTQQKGFSLNGRVLRAPKVGVVKNS